MKVVEGTLTTHSNKITINNETYEVASELAAFFSTSNEEVLQDARIKATVKNGTIQSVQKLTLVQSGVFDGAQKTIEELIVDADHITVQNVIVSDTLAMTEQVKVALDVVNVEAENFKTIQSNSVRGAQRAMTTKVKVTFADSSVGYIEIQQAYSEFHLEGITHVEKILVQADQTVIDSPYFVLPSVKVYRGVTHVELNASIKSVEIESTQPITVKGRGDFEQVIVNTKHPVHLANEGFIQSVKTTSKNIELGTDVKVGQTYINHKLVHPDNVIVNLDEVEGNVGDYEGSEKPNQFLAKAIAVKDRFGYITLETFGHQKGTIKYHQVSNRGNVRPVSRGQEVPKEAILYEEGQQFINWELKDIHVYHVDQNDTVIDSFVISKSNKPLMSINQVDIQDNQFIIKSVYSEKLELKSLLFSTVEDFQAVNPEEVEVQYIDSIPTFIIPLKNELNNLELFSTFTLSNMQKNSILSHWYNRNQDISYSAFNHLKQVVEGHSDLSSSFYDSSSYYHNLAIASLYAGTTIDWDYYDFIWDEIVSELKSLPFPEVPNNELEKDQKVKEINQVHDKVTQNLSNVIEQFQKVTKRYNALFKENRWDYPEEERFKDGVTLEELENLKQDILKLPVNKERTQLENQINSAIKLYNRLNSTKMSSQATDVSSVLKYQYDQLSMRIASSIDYNLIS